MEEKKLSLVAQFDDLCRLKATMFAADEHMPNAVVALLESVEQQRRLWCAEKSKAACLESENGELKKKLKCSETTLKNVRHALRQSIAQKESLMKEVSYYRNIIGLVKNQLIEYKEDNGELKLEKTLMHLDRAEKLQPLMEEVESSDHSLSDLEYDKSEEELVDLSIINNRELKEDITHGKQTTGKVGEDSAFVIVDDEFEQQRNPEKSEEKESKRKSVLTSENGIMKRAPLVSTNSCQFSVEERRLSFVNAGIENRAHNFIWKKVFKLSEKCGPCGKTIAFCASCLRCAECNILCHNECKHKAPLPCIPYVPKDKLGKRGRLILIADFAPLNKRPSIPALIIHCCTEIEKRGKDTEGLYRKLKPKKEVMDMKEKVLHAKNGTPFLNEVDVHMLCQVVKEFLRSLQEPLITYTLWRDFMRAINLESEHDQKTFLYQAISELPIANRDTLAYLMLHLQRVVDFAKDLSKWDVCKLFAPMIVGTSVMNPTLILMSEERPKGIALMIALLDISSDYWSKIMNPAYNAQVEINRRRSSTGKSVMGATSVSSGFLTPIGSVKSKKMKNIKPLL
ncbi:rac GTPase-activating protein 1-like protein [Dinothrombium tinctorium]|uniref:Rac GTPase-activating protein 1-like protein n=1 Tax=Dinothrombium tinctorium TaxID=1965070 RepID=A0A3S4R2V5_9ACAR|nr:rac GTPase-activating protein 1-like protein [Dinothrombium tinctorium]